ncbi:formyl transferase, partial [Pseudomonas sp. MWU13-2860]
RLVSALRWAKARDTQVLLVRGGRGAFSNGVHLNVIQAAEVPGLEAWANIQAIDDVCQELLTARQLVVAGLSGNAGAGGVMLALAADLVFARGGVVLNPHYKTMGLYGSEYWTYSLPGAVGAEQARLLTEACLPLSAREAWRLGMIQDIGPHDPHDFGVWLRQAAGLALNDERFRQHRARKTGLDLEQMERCRQA